MSESDIQQAAEKIENTQQKRPDPEGLSVDQAAAKLREMQSGAEPEPEVELPSPELEPMSEEQTETLMERDKRLELENLRLQLTTEQQRLAEQEEEIKAMREYDPAEYSARMWEHRAQVENFNAALGQFQHTVSDLQGEDIKKQQRHYMTEMENLKKAIPGWNQNKAEQLTKYLMRQGYSREQIGSVTDHKIIKAFWDQMQGVKRKTLPRKKLTKSKSTQNAHNDPVLLADMERRRVSKETVSGAAERIQALLGG